MNSQSRVPIYTGRKEDLADFVGSLNASLYTNPSRFKPVTTGVDGECAGTLIGTGRHLDVSVTVTGPSSSASGTMAIPVRPLMDMPFTVVTKADPCVTIGNALMDSSGVLTLPDWSETDDVIVFGTVVEG